MRRARPAPRISPRPVCAPSQVHQRRYAMGALVVDRTPAKRPALCDATAISLGVLLDHMRGPCKNTTCRLYKIVFDGEQQLHTIQLPLWLDQDIQLICFYSLGRLQRFMQ